MIDSARRFGGLERLWGVEPAQRVRHSHVAVVGVGGVGSWAVEALARSGVQALTLIDLDHIAESNVNRQLHALTATLGQAKVQALQERIAQINPDCHVHTIEDFVTAENWPQILPTPVDAVLDACDQLDAKRAMATWAMAQNKPFVTVGAAGGKRWAHQVDVADLMAVTHDPLLAKLRKAVRPLLAGRTRSGITCVFSKEAVAPPDISCAPASDGSLNCHGYGSVVSVTATFGMCAAGWLMNKLCE